MPFAPELVQREFPPPCSRGTLIAAGRALALQIRQVRLKPAQIERMVLPLLVALRAETVEGEAPPPGLGLVTATSDGKVVLFLAGTNNPRTLSQPEFATLCSGDAWLARPKTEALTDPDTLAGASNRFGFRWFVPELLKHRGVWRDVLLASLALQLVALATPLFTQAIIDKVVVHRTQSTLIAIGIAMMIFTVFSSLLTWVRQYLVLHTGNRVDAVLGAAVWDHLLKLPVRYFQYHATGVVAARLHGVENIREFVASAAVTLVLDMPFLVICLG
ncbi:MAG TPA: ABC transporter transmembrane domain-containing protein, partial [Burkholderiaceae bacterium]|nr:ABC transporter transmembrane domain-containing protein [Burkholderiaceae bacterium]